MDVRRRVDGIVRSLLRPKELREVRLEWVTPSAHRFDAPDAGWIVLRVRVAAVGDESAVFEFYNPEETDWEESLEQLASRLEDWVCETSFAWGQQRSATIPT